MTVTRETTGAPMGCEQFEELLPDYLEHALPPAAMATAESHRRSCAGCAALALDLESIRDDAAQLPVVPPSRDLWAGIEARIGAQVVALDDARPALAVHVATPSATTRGSIAWPRRPWLAAAAALLLVAGTAGVTYTVTVNRLGQPAPAPAVAEAPVPGTLPAVAAAAPEAEGQPVDVDAPSPTVGLSAPAATRGPTTTLASSQPVPPTGALEAAAVYDREIAAMRTLLDERATGLDTATVRVLERNIAIIDQAIRDSRAALERDPASLLLNRQLTQALGVKLELMRTAVLISGAD